MRPPTDALRRLALSLAIVLALLAGCIRPATTPSAQLPMPAAREAVTLSGRVEPAALGRTTQAALADVTLAATVSLIDPTQNRTIASAVTDPTTGAFSLSIPGFVPGEQPYYLEAVKGLNGNQAGSNTAALRTVLSHADGTWQSITGSSIMLGRSSTALSIIAGLKAALAPALQVSPASLIGRVVTGAPDVFSPVTNCSVAEYAAVLPLVDALIAQDRDPLGDVAYESATGRFRITGGPKVTDQSSLAALMEGASVTLLGVGFDPTPANNVVKFNGVPGVVTSASPTRLDVSMRGLGAGAVTVQVGSLVYQGPAFTVSPFKVNDGTTSAAVDVAYQYSPVTSGAGYLYANWSANPNASGYVVRVGTTPGAGDVMADRPVGLGTSCRTDALSLAGAWAGATYYVSVTPVLATGNGTTVISDGVQVAEGASWDGATTSGVRNASDAGYSVNFPAGSNKTQFFGNHYFETVSIANGTTTYVQPFGRADAIGEGASMYDQRVRSPKDGWLGLYANTITVNGTIDGAGRGYGGGPGGSITAEYGRGGVAGLSGNGGFTSGGLGYGAAGGGGCVSGAGGRGGYFGGAGGGGADGPVATASAGNDATTAGGEAYGNPSWGPLAIPTRAGGAAPYGGGLGGYDDNGGGTGAAGYGAGGGGSGGSAGRGGGGAGGTGGGVFGAATRGLGWAPGTLAIAEDGKGGPAGSYLPSADVSTDASWVLGSGGAGGNAARLGGAGEYTAGAGGGAGGGAIVLKAGSALSVANTAKLIVVGAAGGGGGANNTPGSGGGGGGSGGSIVLQAPQVTLQGTMDARGGANGANGSFAAIDSGGFSIFPGGDGGAGATSAVSGGTIKVFYRALTGALPPGSNAGRVYGATY
ncbi:MAG TPA: hypothetical protein V6D00_12165 [Pantanalinema sp.]